MVTLALDTTTPAGSLAIGREGRIVLARAGDPGRPHGERLPGDVLALLADAGIGLSEVTLYAVARGPGAFTGLRIGIACIQGLAFADGRPVVGVSALDALAHGAVTVAQPPHGSLIGTWMDAARREVFAALYAVARGDAGPAGSLAIVEEPSVGPAASILARWTPHVTTRATWLVGDGALRYRDTVASTHTAIQVIETWPAVAASMIPLAEDSARRGLAAPPHAIRPLYVRRPDAEIARDRRAAHDVSPQ